MIYHIFYHKPFYDEHGNKSFNMLAYEVTPTNVQADRYDQVAVIEAPNLGTVFRNMNVVDDSDFEIPRKIGRRSMSVGDVVVDQNGTVSLCQMIGWAHFSDDAFQKRVREDKYIPRFNDVGQSK